MARSRWIAPLCGAAAVAVGIGLVAVAFFTGRTGKAPVGVPQMSFLFVKQEPRFSEAPLGALVAPLGLTDDQRSRIAVIQADTQKAVRTQNQLYHQKRRALTQNLMKVTPRRNPSSPLSTNPVMVGVEQLKTEWRKRQLQALFEDRRRLEQENDRALRELDSKATREIQSVLTDRQRQNVPKIQRAMRDLRAVGLPVSFCGEVLQNQRQRAAIAVIAAEANARRRRNQEKYRTALQAARGARNGPGGTPPWSRKWRQVFIDTYDNARATDSTAYKRALATLTPAQRQAIHRSGANYTP